MLQTQEKNAIKRILQDPAWNTIQRCAELLITNIQDQAVVKDTEWETIRATIERQAMVEGIRKFIQELWTNAQ